MEAFRSPEQAELLATAARLIVEDGMEYGPAKRQALDVLRLPPRTRLPDNDVLEDAVREYIALFCPQEQAEALQRLRRLALTWMERLAEFRPHVVGAVWHGTATDLNDIYLYLFADDAKAVEWRLLDKKVKYHPGTLPGRPGKGQGREREVLTIEERVTGWTHAVLVHLVVMDLDDLKGALKPDGKGRTPIGTLGALKALMGQEAGEGVGS
ncbi:hypothetical protein [Hydrogenophaga sp. 5NK40-0174]|uniref:hypothetical protein n=1 Tax=Hydrogenophaga sp. 5NK40-0174 TaxID=3127649 RepID=UPI0033405C56